MTIIVYGDAYIHLPPEPELSKEDRDILDKALRDFRNIARRVARLDAQEPPKPMQ